MRQQAEPHSSVAVTSTVATKEQAGEELAGAGVADIGNGDGNWIRLQAIASTGLLILGAFYTLYFASAVFIPIMLAVLLKLVLAPLVRRLTKLGLSEAVGAALVLMLVLGVIAYGILQLSRPAADWLGRAPQSFAMVEYKLRDLKQSMEEVKKATKKVENLTEMEPAPSAENSTVVVQGPGLAQSLFTGTSSVLSTILITVVLLYFMLASGDLFLRKTVQVLPRMHDKRRAIEIARQTERDISTYLLTVTVINTVLGCVTCAVMWALDMPNPVLWGVLAGVLNYVPYVGGAAMIAILGLVSLVTFDTWMQILLPPASYLLMTAIEGQLITPMVLGQRLTLNPVVIFVAMLTWGWLWNVPGVLMAVPLLAAFKIICDRVDALRPLGQYLGKRDD